MIEWFIDEYVGGPDCLGNSDVDGLYLDDTSGTVETSKLHHRWIIARAFLRRFLALYYATHGLYCAFQSELLNPFSHHACRTHMTHPAPR